MNHEMARHGGSRNSADYAIYDPAQPGHQPLVGRIVTTGLSDEHADRRYLIVEGTDGLAHHVDAGLIAELPRHGSVVRVEPTAASVRQVDITVAEIAAANGGHYSVDLHLQQDRTATEQYAETHVRRLEALRRQSDVAAREADGSWTIHPDHLVRVAEHEARAAKKTPVRIATLTSRNLDTLPRHDGATWLDRELTSSEPTNLQRGFGAEVRRALDLRRQWLIEQGLAETANDTTRYPAGMVATLERRDLARAGAQLSRELGLAYVEPRSGERIEGRLVKPVTVGDSKYALIQKSREFTLVPWRPTLEKQVGKEVAGIMRATGSISWTVGRSRGLGID